MRYQPQREDGLTSISLLGYIVDEHDKLRTERGVATQFTHANIRLPARVDRALSWVLVSPDMHKVHHHYRLPYTDSNYGNIFSIWDRLLGTYRELDREAIVYGVDTFPDPVENASLPGLLKQPFHKYRKPTYSGEDPGASAQG